jgi:ribonuclease-3
MVSDYSKLYRTISYTFKDISLLNRALTHRSKTKKNYERLEFLGDSILGFVIAEVLYNKFPLSDEGTLSQIRSSLVKGETLAKLSRSFNMDEYVILGGSEKGGAQNRNKILEDILEALIGGIYLDSDFDTAKKTVLKWFENILENIDSEVSKVKDNKSKLQEILLQNALKLPEYGIVSIIGKDHEQVFTVSVRSVELNLEVLASESSRKKAEQVAAGEMMTLLADQELYEKK